jgi:hypothetical protein
MAAWRGATAIAGASHAAWAWSTGLGEMEERHEHDLPYIHVAHRGSAGVHGRDPAELRVDGWGRDEICSVRSDSYRAECLDVTSETTRHSAGTAAYNGSNGCAGFAAKHYVIPAKSLPPND